MMHVLNKLKVHIFYVNTFRSVMQQQKQQLKQENAKYLAAVQTAGKMLRTEISCLCECGRVS